jgi:PAS domain-containing protein
MRTNLPVTNNEIQLTDATLIVSKTDLKGRITYVNKDFLDISGFTEAELIGEPHNLVRHPDMPVEAFQDLWDTLKAGGRGPAMSRTAARTATTTGCWRTPHRSRERTGHGLHVGAEEQGKLGTKLSDARTKLVTDGIRPAVEALVARQLLQ